MPLSWCANADERLRFAAKSPVLKNCRVFIRVSLALKLQFSLAVLVAKEVSYFSAAPERRKVLHLSVPKFVVSK